MDDGVGVGSRDVVSAEVRPYPLGRDDFLKVPSQSVRPVTEGGYGGMGGSRAGDGEPGERGIAVEE